MSVKARACAICAALVVGIMLGSATDKVETEYKVIHDTETVTVTETKEVQTPAPSECRDLVHLARRIERAGGQLDATTAGMLEIMSNLREALAAQNPNEVNDLETELRQLDGRTIGAVETLGESNEPFTAAAAACLKATE